MEESTSAQAANLYSEVIEYYKSRLRTTPDLTLRDYCKESHTNYPGLIAWMERSGIDLREMKREVNAEESEGTTESKTEETFIQFVPSGKSLSGNLLGVSITFPDGVNLTLQESSVESLISLLSIYKSRLGGAKPCLD